MLLLGGGKARIKPWLRKRCWKCLGGRNARLQPLLRIQEMLEVLRRGEWQLQPLLRIQEMLEVFMITTLAKEEMLVVFRRGECQITT